MFKKGLLQVIYEHNAHTLSLSSLRKISVSLFALERGKVRERWDESGRPGLTKTGQLGVEKVNFSSTFSKLSQGEHPNFPNFQVSSYNFFESYKSSCVL